MGCSQRWVRLTAAAAGSQCGVIILGLTLTMLSVSSISLLFFHRFFLLHHLQQPFSKPTLPCSLLLGSCSECNPLRLLKSSMMHRAGKEYEYSIGYIYEKYIYVLHLSKKKGCRISLSFRDRNVCSHSVFVYATPLRHYVSNCAHLGFI